MSSLFGVELPTPVNFVIAFVFVLLLIGVAAWVVRRFGGTRIDAAARGRQPRLAVVDSAAVDARRKLVIVRRDNVEHLLMIGGPSDVVVETNIVRAGAAVTRDTPAAATRMALPDPTPWPLQPEPAPAPAPVAVQPPPPPPRVERPRRAPADDAWDAQPEHILPTPAAPEVRPVRPADTLAELAEEFGQAPEPVAVHPAQVQQPRAAATFSAMTAPQAAPAADQSLAEMAQRLEAALRRPMAQKIVAETQRVTATLDVRAGQPKAVTPPRAERSAAPAVKPPTQQGNLEQEMASLLSRPGKT
jgi:flagellar protein FliO/FliZ